MRAEVNEISRRLMLFLDPEEAEMLETLVRLASKHRLIGESRAEFAENFLKTIERTKR